jgi:hypothetical protein
MPLPSYPFSGTDAERDGCNDRKAKGDADKVRHRFAPDCHGRMVRKDRARALFGKPARSAIIKGFNGRLRGALPKETLFPSQSHARAALAARRMDCNTERPPRPADAARLRPDLHPATGPHAAQPAQLRASPRCPTRPNGQNSDSESRSGWITVAGNIKGKGDAPRKLKPPQVEPHHGLLPEPRRAKVGWAEPRKELADWIACAWAGTSP